MSNLNIDFSLTGMEIGTSKKVTNIHINQGQIPAKTEKIYLVLEDLDFHNFPHGAKLIEYEGADIVLNNSFSIIPLTPIAGSHKYRLTARALDENNNIIGSGQSIQQFP